MLEENKLQPEELEQIEQKQEVKEQKKEENKKTLKTVIISVVCTLLFIIILLLLIFLGLKYCSNIHGDHGSYSSSDSSSEPTYNYDNAALNTQFFNIVNYERIADGYEAAPNKVVAVSYTDNYPNSFSISITALSGNTLYYYHLVNHNYTGDTSSYNNCIEYIYSLNITDRLDSGGALQTSTVTNETIETDKGSHYVISSATPLKYFSGFYLDNNQYKVYNYIEFTSGDNPFNTEPSFKVNSNDPLYGYYQSLNI